MTNDSITAAISDIRSAIAGIDSALGRLAAGLGTGAEGDAAEADTTKGAEPAPQAPPMPLPKLEDVRTVLAQKSRAGHTAQVRELLAKYGAPRLSEVDPADYPALLEDAGAI